MGGQRLLLGRPALRRARVRLLRTVLRRKTKDPHRALQQLERGSASATLWIFLGIVVETGGVVWFVRNWGEALIAVIGNALIGYGLILEYVLILRAIVASGAADREASLKVANAIARAAEADTRALDAQLALEKFKAPRRLTTEQRTQISEKLRQFGGQEFTGSVVPGLADALPLWRQIAGSLRDANWTLVNPASTSIDQFVPVALSATTRPGVGILYSPLGWTSVPNLHTHAEKLAEALNEEGIDAFAWPAHGSGVEINPNAIRIEIGPKS
jgi:hypothetical protein